MTMTESEARDLVVKEVRRIVPDAEFDDLAPDADLRRTFELDSLDLPGFGELLAKDAAIRVDEEDYPELATMTSCQRLLSSRAATPPVS